MENKQLLVETEVDRLSQRVVDVMKAEFTNGPAEVREPVQTLLFWNEENPYWAIESENKTIYEVDEIYCNVSTASRFDPEANRAVCAYIVAVGRLTISGGVAYIDL